MRLPACCALVLFMLAGCSSRPTLQELDPLAVLPGNWGWDETPECNTGPQVLSLSDDASTLLIKHQDGQVSTYRVGPRNGNVLRLDLQGETLKDASGRPVSWDLTLLDADSYCWHRSDWEEGDCTASVLRCD